ncbi:MAG: STAS domain-containing protein [Candidatus Eremiobacteraeota bacterium]|nr:STAS domain-containing protein [Candidatus Eremiobacteraeota bacterium]
MSRTMHHDAIVELRGELDERSRGEIARSFEGLERCHNVLIDLSAAQFVHSALLSELVLLKRRCVVREEPPHVEVRCNPRIARIMSVAGLDRLFEMSST